MRANWAVTIFTTCLALKRLKGQKFIFFWLKNGFCPNPFNKYVEFEN